MADFIGQAEPLIIRPQRAIGSFTSYVVIEESAKDDLDVSQHPVQQGADITDNAVVKPAELSITAQMGEEEGGPRLSELYDNLRELQASRVPFAVVTGKRSYKNMLMTSLSNTTDNKTEYVLAIKAQFKEIIIVSTQAAKIPAAKQSQPGRTQGTSKTGTKTPQTVAPSALSTLAGGQSFADIIR